MKNKTFS